MGLSHMQAVPFLYEAIFPTHSGILKKATSIILLGLLNEHRHINYSATSHNVYSLVYTNKKTNQLEITPSGWLSTVGPAGLEPATP